METASDYEEAKADLKAGGRGEPCPACAPPDENDCPAVKRCAHVAANGAAGKPPGPSARMRKEPR